MNRLIQCQLCPKACRLDEGERGDCRVRINIDGELKTLVYGNPCAAHIDPIEKKPLYHFKPSSLAFSIATAGCNLHCKYCQNWQISQSEPEETYNYNMPPEKVVSTAIGSGCKSIAYTYSEPIIFYEYTLDTSRIAHQQGIFNVLVTAGYINQKPLIELCQYTDAANIDLKGITDDFYKRMCSATLRPVLECIKTMIKQGVWVELTNLIIPTWNDKEKDIRLLCRWIMDNIGPDVPLHFSRFWPMHQLKNLPPTPIDTLNTAVEIAKQQGLHYVYIGNVPGHHSNNTYCPNDGTLLIKRRGYAIIENNVINGKCKFCGTKIPGIW